MNSRNGRPQHGFRCESALARTGSLLAATRGAAGGMPCRKSSRKVSLTNAGHHRGLPLSAPPRAMRSIPGSARASSVRRGRGDDDRRPQKRTSGRICGNRLSPSVRRQHGQPAGL